MSLRGEEKKEMTEKEEAPINKSLIDRRVELERRKRELEAELKIVKSEIERLHGPILEGMAAAGLRSLPLAEGGTIIQRRDLYCNKRAGVPTKEVIKRLKASGFDWLVNESYKASALKEWLREQEKEQELSFDSPEELLPEPLREVFSVYEKVQTVVIGVSSRRRNNGEE